MPVSLIILRIVLALVGLAILVTGINVGFGGILTLGWQGANDFAQVTNQERFLAQDSHVRFLGGIWLAVGITFILAAINLTKFQSALKYAVIATFIGGVMRFSQMNLAVTLGSDILGSLIAEIIIIPLIFVWVSKAAAKQQETTARVN